MSESTTTLSFSASPTALLATSTMTTMITSTRTPLEPLDLHDAFIIIISIIMPVAIVFLCGSLVCSIAWCCAMWMRTQRHHHQYHNYHRDNSDCGELWEVPRTRASYASSTQSFHFSTKLHSQQQKEGSTSALETVLKKVCLIPSGINQLTIHPRGDAFILGNGDARLVAEMGAVGKETVVRYAVILHGPFVYSAGHKPASVVIYLHLDGATLLKPIKLVLNHWCKNPDGEAALRLLRGPHSMDKMQDCYFFDEVQGISSSSRSVFTISEPQCLYCVETMMKTQARYNAIAFQMNLLDSVKFKIQLMCDSLEWNAYLTNILEQKGWENNSKGDVVAKFSFVGNEIMATPHELSGPGWKAAIHGHQAVRDEDFLQIGGKAMNAVDAEVQNGRYPPCIYYHVMYTSVNEQRPAPAFWRAELHGADVKLFFSCYVKQELALHDEISVKKVERDVATVANLVSQGRKTMLPSEYGTLRLKDLVRCAVPRVAPKWDEVGLQLNIQPYVLESIEANGGDVVTRCKNVFSKWLNGETGTGDLQRTWESVLKAVKEAVGAEVCKNVEQCIVQVTDESGPSDPPAKKARAMALDQEPSIFVLAAQPHADDHAAMTLQV